MKPNFRNPPIHEITVSRRDILLGYVDRLLARIVLGAGLVAIAVNLYAAFLR